MHICGLVRRNGKHRPSVGRRMPDPTPGAPAAGPMMQELLDWVHEFRQAQRQGAQLAGSSAAPLTGDSVGAADNDDRGDDETSCS